MLLEYVASGNEVSVDQIKPRLVEVLPNSMEELLFRYLTLTWSIPVSSGYGRRLRFIIFDESNSKVMGLIGAGDPVFALKPRDQWIGWNSEDRKLRCDKVMDLFALGAIPPYSHLLCGKLIAMLATSTEFRRAFKKKYNGHTTLIKKKVIDGNLALLTTTSALGRSSVYNRVKFKQRKLLHSVGYTQGSGDFQFLNGLYDEMTAFAGEHFAPSAKHESWGSGFRNRREVVRKCLDYVNLSPDLLYHGVNREVFVIPLARNTKSFLSGKSNKLRFYGQSASDLFEFFRERWLIPRADRDEKFRGFRKEELMIWPTSD